MFASENARVDFVENARVDFVGEKTRAGEYDSARACTSERMRFWNSAREKDSKERETNGV